MPGPTKFRTADQLIKSNVDHEYVHDSARRILELLHKTGRIGDPSAEEELEAEAEYYLDTPEKRDLLREAASASMVLLKNQKNVLPLSRSDIKLAVFGEHARRPALFGGGSASLKVPYCSAPSDAILERFPRAFCGSGVGVERLVPTLSEIKDSVSDLRLDWFNGADTVCQEPFLSQTLEDSLYMLVEDAPEGLLDRSNFCTSMTFTYVPDRTDSYNISLCGPGNAACLVNGETIMNVVRDSSVSTEDFLFDRSKLEAVRETPFPMQAGKSYKFTVLSWSSKHQAANVNREFFIQGCRFGMAPVAQDDLVLDEVAGSAKSADAAVVVVGTGTQWESEGFDRIDMELPRRQGEMITRIAKACPGPVVVVVNAGSPIAMSSWIDGVDAVIYAWFPGMEFGNALADLLSGQTSPSGRLPTTFWDSIEDYPAGHVQKNMTSDMKIPYREGIYVGYRNLDLKSYQPRFAFGHGLSYTKFEYSVLSTNRLTLGSNKGYRFELVVRVSNVGEYTAIDKVLLFVESLCSKISRPAMELKMFAKTALISPGQSDDVTVGFESADLSYWCEQKHEWTTDVGDYTVRIAGCKGVGDWKDSPAVCIEVPLMSQCL